MPIRLAATPLVLVLVLIANVATWVVYRSDKARARRGQRRVPERVLLGLAAAGGWLGALVAVYGHAQRHKAKKLGFVAWLWAIVLVELAAGYLAYLTFRSR